MAGIEPALPSGTRRPMPRGGNPPLHPLPTPPFVRTRPRNARRRSPCEATRAAGPGVSARTRQRRPRNLDQLERNLCNRLRDVDGVSQTLESRDETSRNSRSISLFEVARAKVEKRLAVANHVVGGREYG